MRKLRWAPSPSIQQIIVIPNPPAEEWLLHNIEEQLRRECPIKEVILTNDKNAPWSF